MSYQEFSGNPHRATNIRLNENVVLQDCQKIEILLYFLKVLILLVEYKY